MQTTFTLISRRLRLFSSSLAPLMLAVVLNLPGHAAAQNPAVVVGQALPTLTLKDQYDKPWQIGPATRLVMFAASRRASNLTQAVLENQPKNQMTRGGAVYLADMSKMPGIITRTFALPSLQKLPYQIGVSLNEATLAAWPRQADAVTLIELDQGLVKRINYATTEADVRAALERLFSAKSPSGP